MNGFSGDISWEPNWTSVAATAVQNVNSNNSKTQSSDDYSGENESETPRRKKVRIRIPVTRTRTAKQHAFVVVRRRPVVPYTKSLVDQPIGPKLLTDQSIEPTFTSRLRKVVTRTRKRPIDHTEGKISENNSTDLSATRTNVYRVTVTRRRRIKPTTTLSSSQRERLTRKKLVNVRLIPEPTPTLAIITTGFYTAPALEVSEDYEQSDGNVIPTPLLHEAEYISDQSGLTTESQLATSSTFKNHDESSNTDEPVIITDNFFFPANDDETTTVDTATNTEFNESSNSSLSNELNDTTESVTEQIMDLTTTEMIDVTDATANSMVEESTTLLESEMSRNETQVRNDNADMNNNINASKPGSAQRGDSSETLNIETEKSKEQKFVSADEDNLKVIPISMNSTTSLPSMTLSNENINFTDSSSVQSNRDLESSAIPTVVPLETEKKSPETIDAIATQSADTSFIINTSTPSLTSEDIEAGLADDLYLSLSRSDLFQITSSKVELDERIGSTVDSHEMTPELQTSVYYTEKVVTSTRLRTYTYVVTKLNGEETEVTSSTTVRPRVTTLTVTIPVTVTITPTQASSSVVTFSSSLAEHVKKNQEAEADEGRKFNLATRVMSNGVEVIVAGTTPAYRWENSNAQPTITLSEAVLMLLPQDKPNEFVTKTCTTTFTYLNTITRDGTTIVSTDQQVIANTATEERHRKPVSEAASVTLEASPTLQTEIFKTTYTYLTLNTDHPDESNALGSSTRVIANTVTAPQYYLDMIIEPSETQKPETNTYMSTRVLEKTYLEDGKTKIETSNDIITQLIITESAPPSRPASTTPALATTTDQAASSATDIAKTYYVTYTYYNTYLENDSTVVKTNIATSSDVVYEKAAVKKASTTSVPVSATPEPIQIFATKTYLTTFTYFTTLLQAGTDGETATTISSRTQVVENVITESIAPSLLDAGYMNALLTTSHHTDSLKNVVTGSTIIFFDDEEPISPTATNSFDASSAPSIDKIDENTATSALLDSVGSETNDSTSEPVEPDNLYSDEGVVKDTTDAPPNKKPSQVSNLLSLGSLGINSLTALGPVITAMAGLLQGKTLATRRNDTESVTAESSLTTTQRSPIYIPVGEFADGDIETAESQNIALHLAANNNLLETRHKVASNLADGIPISPGEVITANSDVIIGKPGKLAPRPPETFLNDDINIGMKPPPLSVPNIPTHPVLNVPVGKEYSKNVVKIQKGTQHLELIPARQIYEEHIQVSVPASKPALTARPHNHHHHNNHYHHHQQQQLHYLQKKISSKQDILENDPLLTPPMISSRISINDSKNRNSEKNGRYPWSQKDPILSQPNVLGEDKNRLVNFQKEFGQTKSTGVNNINSSLIKSRVPEPIVYQVPHVIDRSTGQPLLVNIQPSQVANVVIPQGGTQALIFGDTNEPHISGQYFDDPSPYPEPEVGPGFIGIDKVEHLPQYSRSDANLVDYMTPPSAPTFKTPNFNVPGGQSSQITFMQNFNNNKHVSTISKPDIREPNRHYNNLDLSLSGQGHVHSEILVHQGGEKVNFKTRPSIPLRNYQTAPAVAATERTKVFIPAKATPPRRIEVPPPLTDYSLDAGGPSSSFGFKSEKKPGQIHQLRRTRPTSRPRAPTRIQQQSGYPYGGRPVRPIDRPISLSPVRQPQINHPHIFSPNPYQNEFKTKHTRLPPSSAPYPDLSHQMIPSEMYSQIDPNDKIIESHNNGNYENSFYSPNTKNNTAQVGGNYPAKDYVLTAEMVNNNSSFNNEKYDTVKDSIKIPDSEVDASENVKIISNPQDNDESPTFIIDPKEDTYESSIKSIGNSTASENNQNNFYEEATYVSDDTTEFEEEPVVLDDIINSKIETEVSRPELNGHSRPYSSKPQFVVSHTDSSQPTTESQMESFSNEYNRERLNNQVVFKLSDEKNPSQDNFRYESDSQRESSVSDSQGHSNHPQILTKVKFQVPAESVIISSAAGQKQSNNNQNNNYNRKNIKLKTPSLQFSLPIDSKGEENVSKTQTERPPSLDSMKKKTIDRPESLDTAFQTNFASTDYIDKKDDTKEIEGDPKTVIAAHPGVHKLPSEKTYQYYSNVMIPSGLVKDNDRLMNQMSDGLRPPPLPTDVVGLSPPPVDLTTVNLPKVKLNVSGLKPLFYVSSKEWNVTPPLPSTNMVPPNIKASAIRPYLAEILSQDMVPPHRNAETSRQALDIATIRPGVAVSGSIQIATAVATSHIPVVQDMESKIPIVHGTVDLPVVVDVPVFIKSIDVKKTESTTSAYTVRPFETRHRTHIRPTSTVQKSSSSTIVKQQIERHRPVVVSPPTRSSTSQIVRSQTHLHESTVELEPSSDIPLASTKVEPTELLTIDIYSYRTSSGSSSSSSSSTTTASTTSTSNTSSGSIIKRTKLRTAPVKVVKTYDIDTSKTVKTDHIIMQESASARKSDLKFKESASKMMEIIGTVVHEFIQNSTNEKVKGKPQEVTHYETLTVTRTETSVLGSPPTTRTLLITRTLTSIKVETVTETLLHPTSVISTITSTILQPVTRGSTYEHGNENESIFVVMSDQKPPGDAAEEVEAEYGQEEEEEEEVSRDEQNVSGNEIHRVLSGGILGAPSVPLRPPQVQCVPECKASKSEMCAERSADEMHCICRPGFARLFPDRPCKPTYTFTVGIGLDRMGRDRFIYEEGMNDTRSVVFKRNGQPVKEALDRTLMQSDLRDVYRGLSIVKFLQKPFRVLFNVQFSSNTDESTLKDVIRKYLIMSNFSLGGTDVFATPDFSSIESFDFDECNSVGEGSPHHDCSTNAACFNLKGTYQCSCKEGWADLSENPAYPGRICSQAPIGCAQCNNKGHCVHNQYGQEVCECFPWHSGKQCQFNLKVYLIVVMLLGVCALGGLIVCLSLACLRSPRSRRGRRTRRRTSVDQRAMISGAAGDTSSEGSVAELAIPHHVPHVLPPPPQMLAPLPPALYKPAKQQLPARPSGKARRPAAKKPAPIIAPAMLVSKGCPAGGAAAANEQRDRSITVMIPRAKYRSSQAPSAAPNYRPMGTFSLEEHKLMEYLEAGMHQGSEDKDSAKPHQQQPSYTSGGGALVSAGFQVSAQVKRAMDAESTLGGAESAPEEAPASLVRSCAETSVQPSTKQHQQMLRLELVELASSSLARSCAETSIQPTSKLVPDSASEGHTMAERELGSTLRLPAQHATLYHPDRTSTDRESNFDSL